MSAPQNSLSTLAEAIAQARELIQTEWAAKVPGLAIAVASHGTTLWSEQFGFADLAAQTPITPTSRFRIASISKPLTAAGLALLVERGLLDLDAPVQRYVPDFPQKNGVITSRLLAGHLTGIRNYRGTEVATSEPLLSLRAGLDIFANDPLETPPGTHFSYSSYNWNLLGVAMEAAAGQEFTEYLKASVIGPLGLTNTVPDRGGAADSQRTQFYETSLEGKFIPAFKADYSYKWPAGGYLSTTEDLIRLGNAHLRPGFLKKESVQLLFTSQRTADGKPTHYGVGWFLGRDIIYHGGDNWGGTAMLLLHPASRIVVAITSNGSQLVLSNALRKGNVPREASRFLINKAPIAHRIAKVFAGIGGGGGFERLIQNIKKPTRTGGGPAGLQRVTECYSG